MPRCRHGHTWQLQWDFLQHLCISGSARRSPFLVIPAWMILWCVRNLQFVGIKGGDMCFSRVDSLDNSVIWSTLSGQSIHRIKLCFNVAGQKLVETAPLSPTAGVSTLLFCSSPVQCCKVSCPANGLHHLNNSFLIQHVALRRTCWLASL